MSAAVTMTMPKDQSVYRALLDLLLRLVAYHVAARWYLLTLWSDRHPEVISRLRPLLRAPEGCAHRAMRVGGERVAQAAKRRSRGTYWDRQLISLCLAAALIAQSLHRPAAIAMLQCRPSYASSAEVSGENVLVPPPGTRDSRMAPRLGDGGHAVVFRYGEAEHPGPSQLWLHDDFQEQDDWVEEMRDSAWDAPPWRCPPRRRIPPART